MTKNPKLPQRALRECDVFKSILNLLDSYFLRNFVILCCTNDTICALPNWLQDCVLFGYFKLGSMDHVTACVELQAVDRHCAEVEVGITPSSTISRWMWP